MQIGIPKEIKPAEGRIALLPEAVAALSEAGHPVLVESGAGLGSGFSDDAYRNAGADIAASASALYGAAELIVKVKEPQAAELPLLRADHLLFCFLHLAAMPTLARALQQVGLTAVGFETVSEAGQLPLLQPMSTVAGRIGTLMGAYHLHRGVGGKGVLLGGLEGEHSGRVLVLGAGHAGIAASIAALRMGAQVMVIDIREEPLRVLHEAEPAIETCLLAEADLNTLTAGCDLLVGAVLVAGGRAPILVDRKMVQAMEPGSVILDIAVDQGGCVETIRPTTLLEPAYLEAGVVHLGVSNLPGSVPRTASAALSRAIVPYVQQLAAGRMDQNAALRDGVNVRDGEVVHATVRSSLQS